MMTTAIRTSPLHHALTHLQPTWREMHGMPAAWQVGSAEADRDQLKRAALCDVSALPRLTVKGPGARALLESHGLTPPAGIYAVSALAGAAGGIVARTGGNEYFVEDGFGGGTAARLLAALEKATDAYHAPREDAAIILAGDKAIEVLLQTCGYNFGPAASGAAAGNIPAELVYTRVAGVSCSILAQQLPDAGRVFRLWLDPSYGMYLWEMLLEIVQTLGGGAVGIATLFPHVQGA